MPASVSLSMIVKNEEDHLATCLESAKPYVDEIVVVDTGSTDRTMAIARTYTDKVFSKPWEGDFSAARNYAKSLCAGDWILSLDADESLDCRGGTLREIISRAQEREFFFLPLDHASMGRTGERDQIMVLRLFRNRPEYSYSGRIHEQIIIDNPAAVGCSDAPVIVHRHVPQRRRNCNRHRNLVLLSQAMAAEPDNFFLRYYLASEWIGFGRYGKALPLLREVVAKLTDKHILFRASAVRSLIACLAAAGKAEDALVVCMEESLRYPGYADLFFDGGMLLEKQGEYAAAIKWFGVAAECGRPPLLFSHTSGTDNYLSFYHLGYCHEKLASFEAAESFYRRALAINPGCLDALSNLFHLQIARWPASAVYEHFQRSGVLQCPDCRVTIAELFFQAGYPDLATDSAGAIPENPYAPKYLIYSGRLDEALALANRQRNAREAVPELAVDEFVAYLLKGDIKSAKNKALNLWRKPDERGRSLALLTLAALYRSDSRRYLPEKRQRQQFVETILSIVDKCLRYHSPTAACPVGECCRHLAKVGLSAIADLPPDWQVAVADYLRAKAENAACRLKHRNFEAGSLFYERQG